MADRQESWEVLDYPDISDLETGTGDPSEWAQDNTMLPGMDGGATSTTSTGTGGASRAWGYFIGG